MGARAPIHRLIDQAMPPHLPSPHLPSMSAFLAAASFFSPPHLPSPHLPSLCALTSSAVMKPSLSVSWAANFVVSPSCLAANSADDTLPSLSASITSIPHLPSPHLPSAA